MKKLVCLFSSLFLLSQPVLALPGDTYSDSLKWVQQHAFLAKQTIGPLEGMDFWKVIAYRQLEDNLFLDLELLYDSETLGDPKAKLWEESLYLVKRKPKASPAPDSFSDSRPWEDVAYLNIWQRQHPQAKALLTQVYGAAVAADFANAKLIFQGDEYTEEAPTSYYRRELPTKAVYRRFVWSEDVKIYLGQRYGFEVSKTGLTGRTAYDSLKLLSRSEALTSAQILNKNTQIYRNGTLK